MRSPVRFFRPPQVPRNLVPFAYSGLLRRLVCSIAQDELTGAPVTLKESLKKDRHSLPREYVCSVLDHAADKTLIVGRLRWEPNSPYQPPSLFLAADSIISKDDQAIYSLMLKGRFDAIAKTIL
jgi:hypothetical protein